VHALYKLKSAGAAFCTHLASFMHQMGYISCKADPDLWYKAETQPDDNVRYYAYILVYVDDILCIHHDAMSVLNRIDKYLPLKPALVGDPDIYLGAKLRETQFPNGVWAWGLSPSNYVNQAVQNYQTHLRLPFISWDIFDLSITPDSSLTQRTQLLLIQIFPSTTGLNFTGTLKRLSLMTCRNPWEKRIEIRMMCDCDHAGCKRTHHSWMGILIYCNLVFIQWVSKRQLTIETSVFGAEFVAMKHGIKALRRLQYKLCMMGVPLTGPAFIYGDNKSQVTNSTVPELTLKKKSHSICYHAIRESVAMVKSRITHFGTSENLSDPLTKMTFGAKRRRLLGNVLYDIYDDRQQQ
jgi:hypothetical protein